MLTSKERAYLRGLSNGIETVFHIGKNGITPELTETFDKALEARELVKANVLDNSSEDVRNAAQTIAERTKSDVVQVIGNRFVLFRQSRKNPKIDLPKQKKRA